MKVSVHYKPNVVKNHLVEIFVCSARTLSPNETLLVMQNITFINEHSNQKDVIFIPLHNIQRIDVEETVVSIVKGNIIQ